jgi:hypothetical protein
VKRSFVAVSAGVATAAVASLLAHEASANPPPPKILPDPPVAAPAKDEAPNVVRKHEGVCFSFYPSGGTLAVACPSELFTEPLGEAILKNASGRCQYVPFQSGGPGRTGYLDKCPAMLGEVAKAGVIPESTTKLLQELAASREKSDETPMDPPQPARLETNAPQQVGCGGCATAGLGRDPAASLIVGALGATAARRRVGSRRRRNRV